ncbi:UNVERIFIED_CONTAM: cytochrome [Sesamum radiatum]|uniref:Cytochrome n=1 Tax=Sesamum radiatum TaxID=300843 RepID=A0AAW2VSM5_SESRA
MVIPANTTAMVNMWAITHDGVVWDDPHKFMPERFVAEMGGVDVDVRGRDLRLAPFGAGRRVCPGKNLGLATVALGGQAGGPLRLGRGQGQTSGF